MCAKSFERFQVQYKCIIIIINKQNVFHFFWVHKPSLLLSKVLILKDRQVKGNMKRNNF